MIIGVGIDVEEVGRFRQLLEQRGERLLARLFTERERAYCEGRKNSECHFTARFAAKEAFLKALGEKKVPLEFHEIEILSHESGKPYVELQGKARELAESLGIERIHLSLSHTSNVGAAVIICES